MCVVAAGAGMTAAAAMAANATLAISAVSTIASIGMGVQSAQQQGAQAQASLNQQAASQQMQMEQSRNQMELQQKQQQESNRLAQRQSEQNYNLQVSQGNSTLLQQYNAQKRSVAQERENLMSRHRLDKLGYQRSIETYGEQVRLANESANRVYIGEQNKLNEAKKKAAFQQQAALAKQIGVEGQVLAAGRTGQTIGLLVKDTERQQGFAGAQADASVDSATQAASIGMQAGYDQSQSTKARAYGDVGWNPGSPYLPSDPDVPAFVDGTTFEITNPYST